MEPISVPVIYQAITAFASRDETRQPLRCIKFTPQGLEATDSYRFCAIELPMGQDFEPFLVRVDLLKAALAGVGKKSKPARFGKAVHAYFTLLPTGGMVNVQAAVGSLDGREQVTTILPVTQGTFPSLEDATRACVSQDPGDRQPIGLNTELFAGTMTALNRLGCHAVETTWASPTKAIQMHGTTALGHGITVVQMPVRIG